MAEEQQTNNENNDESNDHMISLSNYILKPKSLNQILQHKRQMGHHKKSNWTI